MVVEPYLLQCVNNLNVDVSANSDAYEPYLFGYNVYVIMYLSMYACVILLCCCPLVLINCSSMTLLCTIFNAVHETCSSNCTATCSNMYMYFIFLKKFRENAKGGRANFKWAK